MLFKKQREQTIDSEKPYRVKIGRAKECNMQLVKERMEEVNKLKRMKTRKHGGGGDLCLRKNYKRKEWKQGGKRNFKKKHYPLTCSYASETYT